MHNIVVSTVTLGTYLEVGGGTVIYMEYGIWNMEYGRVMLSAGLSGMGDVSPGLREMF